VTTRERRTGGRSRPAPRLEVRCTNADAPAAGDDAYNLARKIVDVSSRGACVVTTGRLRRGVPVAVDLFVPGSGARFRSKATVQWSTTVESRGREAHVAGLRFDRMFHPESAKRPAPEPHPRPAPASPPRPSRRPALPPSPEPVREHKRFSPGNVGLVCLPRGILRRLGLAGNAGHHVKDLSRGGAQIVCSQKLKPGQVVDLRLEFHRPKLSLEAEAVIRWCRRDTTSLKRRYLAGIVWKSLPLSSERSLRAIESAFLGF